MDVILRFGSLPWQRKKIVVRDTPVTRSLLLFYGNLLDLMKLTEDEFCSASLSDFLVINVSRKAFRRLKGDLLGMAKRASKMEPVPVDLSGVLPFAHAVGEILKSERVGSTSVQNL
jgi:hypothetical protein